ncbi:MAG: isoprenylcysteine carboxylmethyltransferase family protein [Xanthomonadaceae bacterium]|jgi:protein-S-isoprenylcysteine O-methyltransferase Ste14|nr:isoprenylcysteine carboxylmethyltransferase family protein [Xanthomonadaceae bacterium]MDE3071754.1 isoprenylcysteine carboxylmethyltransferase family protein [Pseudomonadota bacterium]
MNPFELAWVIWMLIWLALSFWSKRTQRHDSAVSRILYMLPLLFAVLLMVPEHLPGGMFEGRAVPYLSWFNPVGLALTWSGLAFSVWARVYLGSNWSGAVEVKQQHELVRGGPYRFVRHPIYTGMLAGFLGSAMAMDEWRGAIAVLIVLASFLYKLRKEERFMVETFGEAYLDYRRKIRALIPFVL